MGIRTYILTSVTFAADKCVDTSSDTPRIDTPFIGPLTNSRINSLLTKWSLQVDRYTDIYKYIYIDIYILTTVTFATDECVDGKLEDNFSHESDLAEVIY